MKSMAAKLETVSSMRQQMDRLAQAFEAAAAAGGSSGNSAPVGRPGGARTADKGADSHRCDPLKA